MHEEAEAIRRVVDGDVDSFRILVKRYQQPVVCLIRNLVPDSHAWEDIAQDVFLAAFDRLASFDPARGSFRGWLTTIARNKCLNALKKKRPAPAEELPDAVTRRTPADEVAERELFERLDRALEQLPLEQKTAFVMSELVGLSYEEIAEIESVKLGTVRSRISRGKQALRGLLGEYTKGES